MGIAVSADSDISDINSISGKTIGVGIGTSAHKYGYLYVKNTDISNVYRKR